MDKLVRTPTATHARPLSHETVASLQAQGYHVLVGNSGLVIYSRHPWSEVASKLAASAQPKGVHA